MRGVLRTQRKERAEEGWEVGLTGPGGVEAQDLEALWEAWRLGWGHPEMPQVG